MFWTGELLDNQLDVLASLDLKEVKLGSYDEVLPKFLQTCDFNSKLLIPWYGREG
jgi:hypothetical protein